MSGDSATPPVPCATTPLPLVAAFDGGRLTSDGGLPWLAKAEAATGRCAAFAADIREWRRGTVRHSLATLVRPRGCCPWTWWIMLPGSSNGHLAGPDRRLPR